MHNRKNLARELRRLGCDPLQIITSVEISKALHDCENILDIGCGPASPLRLMGFKHLVGIEGYAPSCEAARAAQTHDEIVLGDVRYVEKYFEPGQFDACVALDLIEHLTKEDGRKLISSMERMASKRVVIFTPNGFLPQRHAENADLQEHLSGWDAAEMRNHGYRVAGILGPKYLRGEWHRLKYKPKAFWGMVSLVGQQLFTRRMPKYAAAILCVKYL